MSSMLQTSRSGSLKARCPRLVLETAIGRSVEASKAAGSDGLIPVSIRWHAGVIESVEPVPDAEGLVLPRLVGSSQALIPMANGGQPQDGSTSTRGT